jgi:glucose/mannose-6-phosphate isomerase
VTDLDDAAALRAADPSDMLGAVARLGADAVSAYAAGRGADVASLRDVTSVVVAGMGGSAVAGDVLRSVFRDRATFPVDVNRGHTLPAYAGTSTLVIVSSYSGETAETLSAFAGAVDRGCQILAVTSGGTLASSCQERGFPVVRVPGGGQPRAALGHLAFGILGALGSAGLLPTIDDDVAATAGALDALAAELAPEVPSASNRAKDLASWIGDRVPVMWGADGSGAVAAMRWKTQMNENGKIPAWHASMSELDHNEVVGWVRPYGERYAVIALYLGDEEPEIVSRFELSSAIVRDAGAEVREVRVEPGSTLQRQCSLVMLGDMTSCYVGLRRGFDPTPVEAIARLKAALAAR